MMRDCPNTNAFYVWDNMGFFTNWLSADHQVTLCFDLPLALQARSQSALFLDQGLNLNDPYSSHTIIVGEVLSLFDLSVWSLRDSVRMLEKGMSIMRTDYMSAN